MSFFDRYERSIQRLDREAEDLRKDLHRLRELQHKARYQKEYQHLAKEYHDKARRLDHQINEKKRIVNELSHQVNMMQGRLRQIKEMSSQTTTQVRHSKNRMQIFKRKVDLAFNSQMGLIQDSLDRIDRYMDLINEYAREGKYQGLLSVKDQVWKHWFRESKKVVKIKRNLLNEYTR